MTIYGEGGEVDTARLKLRHASKIGAVQLTDRGPVKSTFLVTFTDGYFVVAVFSRNETRRSGNWTPLSKNLRRRENLIRSDLYRSLRPLPTFFFSNL